MLSNEEGSTLQIAHDYRTPAFHRDDHNPKALQALACLLYSPIATLFKEAGGGIGIGGDDERYAWLAHYGLKPTGMVMFGPLSVALVNAIRATIPMEFDDIRIILHADLAERMALAENNMAASHSLGELVDDWDAALSDAMFWSTFDEQAAAPEYWDLVWKIGAGEDIVPEDYLKAQDAFNAEKIKQKEAFVPEFRIQQLPKLKASITALEGITTPAMLAGEYRNIDRQLVLLEDAIKEVHISIDHSIQLAIDLARGK